MKGEAIFFLNVVYYINDYNCLELYIAIILKCNVLQIQDNQNIN